MGFMLLVMMQALFRGFRHRLKKWRLVRDVMTGQKLNPQFEKKVKAALAEHQELFELAGDWVEAVSAAKWPLAARRKVEACVAAATSCATIIGGREPHNARAAEMAAPRALDALSSKEEPLSTASLVAARRKAQQSWSHASRALPKWSMDLASFRAASRAQPSGP